MNRAGVILLGLTMLLTGCPPGGGLGARPSVPPRGADQALHRVNVNLARIREPLSCPALVSFRFKDSNGKKHSFIGHEARLIYKTPQSLYFDVRAALSGSVARFGSNQERYWLWVDAPDVRKLWWGSWERIDEEAALRLPVPPNELLDALMLRPLPESLSGGPPAMLRIEGGDYRLVFFRPATAGRPGGMREVRLDQYEPYQPLEIIDRLPDGQVAMHAELRNYRRVGLDGPYTPRKYVVRWPLSDAEVRLDIHGAKFRPELPGEVFDFPTGWQGEVERIDAPSTGAGSQ